MLTYLNSFNEWKNSLALPNPGTFEGLHREAKNVSLTNIAFEGGKADLAKGLSPSFQVSHAFTLGSPMLPPTYHFASIYLSGKHLLHGMIDTNGIFQGKYHYSFTPGLSARLQTQVSPLPGQSMFQSELDYQGTDYALNAKAINPDFSDRACGIYTVSYLQSVHPNVALGLEAITQRMPEPMKARRIYQETALNFVTRFIMDKSIFTLNLQQLSAMQASFFHKISDKVEIGTEWQAVFAGPRKDSLCTAAVKLDYKQALIRAQIDTTGKVGLHYEEKLFPGFSLLLSGELDHVKQASRWGVGVNLEN